jgi:3-phenylpropionate/cinnamic acid dioxygenase small subunit
VPEIDPAVFAAVQDLQARYAHFIDDRRLDECAELFHHDAVLVLNGSVFEGRAAIREWLDGIGRRPAGRHLTSNVMLTEVGERRASSVADLTYWRRSPEARWELGAIGRYSDEMAWIDSSWVFTRRQIDLE